MKLSKSHIGTVAAIVLIIGCEFSIDSPWLTSVMVLGAASLCAWSAYNDKKTIAVKEQKLRTLDSAMHEAAQLVATLGKDSNMQAEVLQEDDDLMISIRNVDTELKQFNEKERKRNWRIEGLAKFSELLRSHEKSIEELSSEVINNIVKYVGANQGAIFLHRHDKNTNDEYLEMTGCYAYAKKRFREKRIEIGHGSVGQCFIEKDTIYLLDIPQDYVNITSGLGAATPSNVVVVPLLLEDKVYGVIELATFQKLEPYRVKFLEQLSENIASVFASLNINQRTAALLQESQELTTELKSQEEEMRQSMEELSATQEEMSRKQSELDSIVNAIDKTMGLIELNTVGEITYANTIITEILEYSDSEMLNRTYKILIGNEDRDKEFLSQILDKQVQAKYYETVNKRGETKWMSTSFTPIKDHSGRTHKILVLSRDVTQRRLLEKEKQRQEVELASQMEAINKTIASVEFDLNGYVKWSNDIFNSITGIDNVEKLHYSDIIPPTEVIKPQTEMMWNNLRDGKFFSGEFKMQDQNGKELWLVGTFNPIKNMDGEPYKVMMYAQFNTKEKEKQKDLIGTVNALKNTALTMDLNTDGTFKSANDLFLKQFGYSRLELRKKPFGQFIDQGIGSYTQKVLKEIERNQFFEDDLNFVFSNGESNAYHTTFNAIYDLEDKLSKIVVIMLDKNKVSH